jgi:hypothetical protein
MEHIQNPQDLFKVIHDATEGKRNIDNLRAIADRANGFIFEIPNEMMSFSPIVESAGALVNKTLEHIFTNFDDGLACVFVFKSKCIGHNLNTAAYKLHERDFHYFACHRLPYSDEKHAIIMMRPDAERYVKEELMERELYIPQELFNQIDGLRYLTMIPHNASEALRGKPCEEKFWQRVSSFIEWVKLPRFYHYLRNGHALDEMTNAYVIVIIVKNGKHYIYDYYYGNYKPTGFKLSIGKNQEIKLAIYHHEEMKEYKNRIDEKINDVKIVEWDHPMRLKVIEL